MSIWDICQSLFVDSGKDVSDSFVGHGLTLAKVAFREFSRNVHSQPPGFFEEAGIRFPSRMLNIRPENETITIVPIGDVHPNVMSCVCRIVWEIFGCHVRITRCRSMYPGAYDRSKTKADANVVLKELQKIRKHGKVIGLTDIGLFVRPEEDEKEDEKKYRVVYGLGDQACHVCVVSTSDFDIGPLEHFPFTRLVKVVIHELGHTFGTMHHGEETAKVHCIMNLIIGSDKRTGMDFITPEFCSRCLGDIVAGRSQYDATRVSKKEEKGCWAR